MKALFAFLLALTALLPPDRASAQAGAYGLFTGANIDTQNSLGVTTATRNYGGTFGIYANFPTPVVKFGLDLRGSILNGGGEKVYYGSVGPRIELNLPVIALRPYVEGLAGAGQYHTLVSPNTNFHATYEVAAGADRRLLPFIDWRVLEFSYTQIIEGGLPIKALSTGIVVRIP